MHRVGRFLLLLLLISSFEWNEFISNWKQKQWAELPGIVNTPPDPGQGDNTFIWAQPSCTRACFCPSCWPSSFFLRGKRESMSNASHPSICILPVFRPVIFAVQLEMEGRAVGLTSQIFVQVRHLWSDVLFFSTFLHFYPVGVSNRVMSVFLFILPTSSRIQKERDTYFEIPPVCHLCYLLFPIHSFPPACAIPLQIQLIQRSPPPSSSYFSQMSDSFLIILFSFSRNINIVIFSESETAGLFMMMVSCWNVWKYQNVVAIQHPQSRLVLLPW